ncbi:hypothetical protein EJ110_NYTH13512 [Nymphaea thermarum]|nr:hypothetical protein EJ110_NYTH13512 [Nymphaea thermarum]
MVEEEEDDGKKMACQDEGSLVPALDIEMPNKKVGQTSSKKGGGWFLVRRFNISNIRASQITNIFNSVMYLSPVAGAILCDSYLGSFLTMSFDRKKEQERFVSYYFITTTVSTLVPSTVIVYVMDNVGWNWGYGLCAVLSAISLNLFLPAKWFCRDARPEGSPFINLARVVVSAARKIQLSVKQEDYCHGSGKHSDLTSSFSDTLFRVYNG